jgi:protein-S-isoprenylcysteine O-methyltransferase Ste14
MYGFPVTMYLLSGWLARTFPGVDQFSHDFGHLWYTLLGFKGDPHLNPIHIASTLIIAGGFILVASAWRVLFQAQTGGTLATGGAYAHIRHPQYVAFLLIMFGFLLQWPTLVTAVMFPVLVTVYVRLARREERDVRAAFGPQWDAYAARTPPFVPRLWRSIRPTGDARNVHA